MSDAILHHSMELKSTITDWCKNFAHLSEWDRSGDFLHSQLEKVGIPCDTFRDDPEKNRTQICIDGGVPGRCITICADGIVLPYKEKTLLSVQAAVALGAATLLRKCREQLVGRVELLFPQRERSVPASSIGKERSFRSDAAIGFLPVVSSKEAPRYGQICFFSGDFIPCLDQWEFTVMGKGGHGAYPQNCIDPVPPACRIVESLLTIISREKNPAEPAEIAVEEIRTDSGAFNIIADECVVKGTARSCSETFRGRMRQRINDIAYGIASLAGADVECAYRAVAPVLYNSPDMTMEVVEYTRELFGKDGTAVMSEGLGGGAFFADWDRFSEKMCSTVFFPPISEDRVAERFELWRLSAFIASAAFRWLAARS